MARWTLTWIIMLFQGFGECLKCFQCDNFMNPACGVNFKSYQYPPEDCPGSQYKCGLQRQHPKGDYIGIIRACYPLGSLGLEDESDSCQEVQHELHNTTFLFCLCSEDYCNIASRTSPSSVILHVIVIAISFGVVTLGR
ncbi:uncharacterized protein LOC123537340 [Mercenaria mercenaria]|uniref:uncharacterized protein LOC123537340 n=1 Tax=Mercenaria mercenaria TaxID=6596 RepID=UPI001E1DEBA9|nr:uncharacterized protein LOC123537340 [Mercenaria mercenaria]